MQSQNRPDDFAEQNIAHDEFVALLAAVEPVAEHAKFNDELSPDVRRMRWELDVLMRLVESVHKWLKKNHPDDFPELV